MYCTFTKKLLLSTGLILSTVFHEVQAQKNDTLQLQAIIFKGDTLTFELLEEVSFHTRYADNHTAKAKYNRLRNAVYVTYPYARRAAVIMNDINQNLVSISGKKARKKYIRSREKDLKKEFTDPLSNLSVYQGKVLMKLIYRETGDNCYEIIKEYKGGLNARIYQTVAFFYNSNLKQSYDPQGKDGQIEFFVREMQHRYGYTDIKKVREPVQLILAE